LTPAERRAEERRAARRSAERERRREAARRRALLDAERERRRAEAREEARRENAVERARLAEREREREAARRRALLDAERERRRAEAREEARRARTSEQAFAAQRDRRRSPRRPRFEPEPPPAPPQPGPPDACTGRRAGESGGRERPGARKANGETLAARLRRREAERRVAERRREERSRARAEELAAAEGRRRSAEREQARVEAEAARSASAAEARRRAHERNRERSAEEATRSLASAEVHRRAEERRRERAAAEAGADGRARLREAYRVDARRRRVVEQRHALDALAESPVARERHRRRRAEQARARRLERSGRRAALPATGNPGPHVALVPSGALSGTLPWLHAAGPLLVDELDARFTLRGVTVRGLERADPAATGFAVPMADDDLELMRRLGATVIAVPISQDLALEGRGDADGEDYLSALDATIAAAADAGLYTIVRLSLLSSVLPTAAGPGGDRYDPPLPDPASVDLWALVAHRYAQEPAVLFELFRSPHDPGPGDSTALLTPRVDWGMWTTWLLSMLGAVRREHPRSIAILRGLGGGRDLSGFPLPFTDGTTPANIVYAAQLRGGSDDVGVLTALESLHRRFPVAVPEQYAERMHGLQVERLGRVLARADAHWLAGDWNGDAMPLVRRDRGRLRLTPLGRAFAVALAVPSLPVARRPIAR
jgi:Cellulase (glycosyl hydrolase family 5)